MNKNVLILSSDEKQGGQFVAILQQCGPFKISHYSYRADAVESVTNQEFDGLIFFDPKGTRDVELLIRYIGQLSSKKALKIFIASSTMDLFKETIEQHLDLDIRLIALPKSNDEVANLIGETLVSREEKTAVKNGYRVDTAFIRVFIDATTSVMTSLLGDVRIRHMTPFFMSARLEDVSLCSHIIIESDYFSGTFYFAMPADTYLTIYQKIVGEEYTSICEENSDFINEMTNMIYGNSKAIFEKMDYKFEMAFPKICNGDPLESGQDIVVIPYNSDVGRFYLEIGIN